MNSRVFLRVNRVDSAVCEEARTVTVADIHESMGSLGFVGLMSERMKSVTPGTRCVGPAITAFCAPGDNLMAHRALSLARPGDVVVFVLQSEDSASAWGDVATHYAVKAGLAGAVVQGSARDVDCVRALNFPVWSTLVRPIHAEKSRHGIVNAPVICGGVHVCPGDLIAADGDGVVVVPRQYAAEVVAAAKARMLREEQSIAAIQGGASPWTLGAGSAYAALCVEEIDATYDAAR